MSDLSDRIAAPTVLDTRSSNMTKHSIKKYSASKLYIVDDVDKYAVVEKRQQQTETRMTKKRKRITEHEEACIDVRDLFEKYTDCQVVGVAFPEDAEASDVYKFWKEESEGWDADELIIVYYHGDAGGEGQAWKWHMATEPGSIKVHKIANCLSKSNADVMLLLDCFAPDNITKEWTHRNGHLEIYARPERMQTRDDHATRHDKDFTSALTENLADFVDNINEKGRKKSQALRSIKHILAKDKEMYSRMRRIDLDQVETGKSKVVYRFMVDPQLVRKTGKLEFFAKRIQNGKAAGVLQQVEGNGEEEDEENEDEGIGMDDCNVDI